MIFAGLAFFLSLALIVLLFGVKHWETARQRVLFPGLRARADNQAIALKALLERGLVELQGLPPFVAYLSRLFVHEAALGFARLARLMEAQAHNIAELVSHKRTFEPRETRSEFLKKVSDRTSGQPGPGSNLDSTNDNGHNA